MHGEYRSVKSINTEKITESNFLEFRCFSCFLLIEITFQKSKLIQIFYYFLLLSSEYNINEKY